MGKKGDNQVQETSAQRANADVGAQQLADFHQRWQPFIKRFAANTEAAGAADSYQRRHATSLATTDTAAQFAGANQSATGMTAARGNLGTSGQKLAITGMGNDQATSAGLGAVAADQGVSDATIQGLGAVAAIGRGEKATAIEGMQRQAQISGAQAKADAQNSLESQMGDVGLAGKIIGTGAALWNPTQGASNTTDYRGTTLPNTLRGGQ
jgi:hypothetical protein